MKFVNDGGFSVERPAYFDHGAWRAVLVAPFAGRYKSTLYHNGHASLEEAVPLIVDLNQAVAHGFVTRDPNDSNRFQYDDGTLIYPIGCNLGWHREGFPPLEDQIQAMGQNGLHWTRIWSSSWDDKNPWWPVNDPYAMKGQLWPKALDRWASLANDCDDAGVNYQFVLFDSRSLDPNADPGWSKNPWNAANGGFLHDPAQFFTDPEAIRREKIWIRYAAERWSGDPFLFGWELMADIGSADPSVEANIQAWTKEMAAYLRSVDPYDHLLTVSEKVDDPSIWALMDYSQNQMVPGMPGFAARIDDNADQGPTDERLFLRSEIWDSIRKNDGATAMYGHWERVAKDSLYPELKTWAQIIGESKLAEHPLAQAVAVKTSTGEAQGLRDTGWILIRLRHAKGKTPKLSWPGMVEGTWESYAYDLDSGLTEKEVDAVRGTSIQLGQARGNDVVLIVRTAKD